MTTQDAQTDTHTTETAPLLENANPVGDPPESAADSEIDSATSELQAAIEQARTEALEEARKEHSALTMELAEAQSKVGYFESEAATLRRELDLTHVAYEHDVPRELLQGDTRDEMEQFAAALRAYRADRPVKIVRPASSLKSGANLRDELFANPRQQAVDAARASF